MSKCHIVGNHTLRLCHKLRSLLSVQPTSPCVSKNRRRKRYPCCFCEKQFSAPSILIEHERIHTGERPYVCSICGKDFKRAYHLRSHQRIHTGEKPYRCELCGRCFLDSRGLRLHLLTHKKKQIDELLAN